MQIVHLNDPFVGSLNWELPQALADSMDAVPANVREIILEDISTMTHAVLLTLLAAYISRDNAGAVRHVRQVYEQLTYELVERFNTPS
jgi:predicted sugar kinase